MAVDAKNILSLEKVRLYRLVRVLAVLILILGILFTDWKITDDRRTTQILLSRLLETLVLFDRLRFLGIFFSRHPLNDKSRVVVWKKVVVEVLLDEVGRDEVFKSNKGKVFLFWYLNRNNFSECTENLQWS